MVKWGKYLFSNYLIMSVKTPKLTQEEQACFEKVSKVPEAERQSVFASNCSALKEHSRNIVRELLKKPKQTIAWAVLIWAWAVSPLQAWTPSPQETQKVEQSQTTQETFDSSKVPEAFKENIKLINSKLEEWRKTWEFTKLDWFKISDWTPNSLASSLNNAPDVEFSKLTKLWHIATVEEINNKTVDLQLFWEDLINWVFDLNGDKSWLTTWIDRKKFTPEKLETYMKDLSWQKERMSKKLLLWGNEIDKWKRHKDTILWALQILDYCVQNWVFHKTEARRRCVTAVITILNFATLNEELKQWDAGYFDIMTDLSNQAWEFLILTQKWVHLTRLVVSWKTYTFPSDDDIANDPVLSQFPILKWIWTKSLNLIGEKLKNNWNILTLDDLRNEKEKIVSEKEKIVSETKELKNINDYYNNINKKYQEIISLTKEYNNHKNDSTWDEIKRQLLSDFSDLSQYKKEIELKLNETQKLTYKKEYEDLLVRIDEVLKIQQAQKLG